MRTVSLIAAVISLCSCGDAAGDREPGCDPVGTWDLVLELGPGDCLEPGTVLEDVLRVEAAGAEYRATWGDGAELEFSGFNPELCRLALVDVFYSPATDTTYEISGTSAVKVVVVGDTLTGTIDFEALLMVDGSGVECSQVQYVTGNR